MFNFLLLFIHQVVSYSLWPHRLQHARLSCPSLFLEFAQVNFLRTCQTIFQNSGVILQSPKQPMNVLIVHILIHTCYFLFFFVLPCCWLLSDISVWFYFHFTNGWWYWTSYVLFSYHLISLLFLFAFIVSYIFHSPQFSFIRFFWFLVSYEQPHFGA